MPRLFQLFLPLFLGGCYLATFPAGEAGPAPLPSNSTLNPEPSASAADSAPLKHLATLPPLLPDEVPARLGSQATSLAAKPRFASHGYAPQMPKAHEFGLNSASGYSLSEGSHPDACQIFREANAARRSLDALEGDMLACAAVSSAMETKFAFNLAGQATTRVDLRILASFDPAKLRNYAPERMEADGPDDSGYACLLLPVVHLSRGKALHIAVDNLGTLGSLDQEMGNHVLEFKGELPMEKQKGSLKISCRLVPRLDVEVNAKQALGELDKAISLLDTSLVVRMDQPTDFGRIRLHMAKAYAAQVAAWIGWDDLRLGKRMERLAMLEQRFDSELFEAYKALWEKLPRPSEWVALESQKISMRAPLFYCADKDKKALYERALKLKDAWPRYRSIWEKLDCLVHIGVRNDSAAPKKVIPYNEGINGLDTRFMDRYGFTWPLHWVGTMQADGPKPPENRQEFILNPGDSIEFLYDIQTDYPISRRHFLPDPMNLLPDPTQNAPFALHISGNARQGGYFEPKTSRFLRVPSLEPVAQSPR